MKSFSNFLIEKELNPRKGEREASERLVKKLNKISKKGNIPDKKLPFQEKEVKTGNKPESVKNQMAKNIAKQDIEKSSGKESGRIGSEGSGKVKDTVKPEQAKGYKSTEKIKLTNTTRGGEVKVTRPVGTTSGDESRKLGKLNKRTGKLNFDKNAELQAKRSQRINTTTGKATPKGVENFAMNRGGYSRRNIPKSELGKIKTDARRIASSPSSRAYKEIEASINASDYAGKRAKGDPNAAKLSDVKKAIDSKKGKFGVGSANPTRLGKSGGKLPVPTTIGVKQSEVSKKAKAFGQKIEKIKQAKASAIKDPWKSSKVAKGTTLDSVGTKKYNIPDTKSGGPKNPNPDYLARMQRGASGMDSNVGGGASGTPSKNTTFKDFNKKTAGKPLELRNTSSSIVTTRKGNVIKKGADGSRSLVGSKGTGTSSIVPYTKGGTLTKVKKGSDLVTSNTTGKLSNTAWKANAKKGIKSFKNFTSKLPKPIKAGGKLLGKAAGPAIAAIDGIGNYMSNKKQGYNTSGSIVRAGAKTGSFLGGYAAGAKGGAALGATIGTAIAPGVGTAIGGVLGGLAGGVAGGNLAGKAADWAIKGYDKAFGRQKLKDIKAKNVKNMKSAELKANPYKGAQPQISSNRIATTGGNLKTITLKKGKDGAYIMPKGFKKGKTVDRITQLASKG